MDDSDSVAVFHSQKIDFRSYFSYFSVTEHSYVIFNYILNREEAVAALNDGIEQLKVLQRQAIVSSLYPSSKSVME